MATSPMAMPMCIPRNMRTKRAMRPRMPISIEAQMKNLLLHRFPAERLENVYQQLNTQKQMPKATANRNGASGMERIWLS